MRIEPVDTTAQSIYIFFPHRERQPHVVCEAVLAFQVGITARQKIEVVQRGKTVVPGDGCFRHDIAFFRQYPVDEESRDNRGPFRTEHILAKNKRGGKTIDRPPFRRNGTGKLDTSLVIPDNSLVTFLRDDIFVRAFHQMLVYGNTGREQPFL